MPHQREFLRTLRFLGVALAATQLVSCVSRDRIHRMVVSVPEQKMQLFEREALIAEYPVSTSKFGLGDRRGSKSTPLGWLEIERKIGTNAPSGAVFKSRRRTGEIIAPDSPGRDPIVTRILWLKGLEDGNRDSYSRYIYIHGTPEERNIGQPASYGCIRMRSTDVVDLYRRVGVGAKVHVVNAPFDRPVPRAEAVMAPSG